MGAIVGKKLGSLVVRLPCSAARDSRCESGGGLSEVFRLAVEAFPFPSGIISVAFARSEMTIEIMVREGDDVAELSARAQSFLPPHYRRKTAAEYEALLAETQAPPAAAG